MIQWNPIFEQAKQTTVKRKKHPRRLPKKLKSKFDTTKYSCDGQEAKIPFAGIELTEMHKRCLKKHNSQSGANDFLKIPKGKRFRIRMELKSNEQIPQPLPKRKESG
jgi:hypothetical protein